MPDKRKDKIRIYYHEKICPQYLGASSETPSPLKPRLFMDFIDKNGLSAFFETEDDFQPFGNVEFYLAHTREYVDGFFAGVAPHSTGRGLLGVEWSESFAESVRYTNASLYEAILGSIMHPDIICLSPTSGFHHAVPEQGALFCAFSGQVISALKIYRTMNMSAAFIDLDGHFGNSIEDSRGFVPDLDLAIPKGGNLNIKTKHAEYLEDLRIRLLILQELILSDKVHYLVFCHGADSHEEDDIGSQLSTDEWIACAELFCEWLKATEKLLGHAIPLSLSLFGGYRRDDFDSVLSLHAASLMTFLNRLSGVSHQYVPKVSLNMMKKR